ncbi:MAG: hypothetical protein ACE5R4_03285 [Armatimonadota bacterium]
MLALTLVAASCAQAQEVELGYQWRKGDAAEVSIVVEGRGEARQLEAALPLSLSAAIEAREEVTRLSTGGTAIITTTWKSADLVVDGEKVSVPTGKTVLEKKVGRLGESHWSRTRGKPPTARREGSARALGVEHLALLDLLVEQVEYPLLPPYAVEVDGTWETRETADFGGEQIQLRQTTRLASVGTGAEAGLCQLETTIEGPLQFTVPAEELRFTGKIAGTIDRSFDNTAGRLNSGEGLFEFDLRANPTWLGALPAADDEPIPPTDGEIAGGAPLEGVPDLFRLKMTFMVRVTRQ